MKKSGESTVLVRKLELLNHLYSKNLIRVEVLVKRQDIIIGQLLETVRETETAIESKYIYDAFISYRHQEPDRGFARRLLKDLEHEGYKVAIDERDFRSEAAFLNEMERCIKESRFTLCIVSPRYLKSENCDEEAVICKVLDMSERIRRLLPLTIEKAETPIWMYGIVGIDFTVSDPLVAPLDKLKSDLGSPRTAFRRPAHF
jgi:hypothetical protein